MPLSALDETLMHQGPVTFDQAIVSDHRFFDRIALLGHCHKNIKFIMGMAVYKNMNAFDGFLCVQKDGKQHNLRVARSFTPALGALSAGPLSVDILEPLKRLKIVLKAGDSYEHAGELTFTGVGPVHEEAPSFRRVNGRIQQDYKRFDQIGRFDGWLGIEHERIEITDWFGVRDHSWGVRPGVGGYEPATSPLPEKIEDPAVFGLMWIWLAFRTDDMTGQLQHKEDGNGRVMMVDGHIRRGEDEVAVRNIDHDIDFVPGTRVYQSARLKVGLANGETLQIEADALLSPWCFKGSGYDSGFDDEKGLGWFRGERVEADIYDVSHPEDVVLPDGRVIQPWHREQPVTLTVNGAPGLGHMPVINLGLIRRYGLEKPANNEKSA